MKGNIAKTIAIIVLAVATVGLCISTVLLAISNSNKAEEIDGYKEEISSLEKEADHLKTRAKKMTMAACLVKSYELSGTFSNRNCAAWEEYISNKTDAELDEVMPKGY